MKLETLQEFIVVAEHLNITKAAQQLYLSQPSLSTHITTLEKELGYALFERSRSGITLTSAGSILLDYAQQIVNLYEEALTVSACAARAPVTVKVATIDSSSPFQRFLPSPKLHSYSFVDMGVNTSAIDALQQGLVDVALCVNYAAIEDLREEALRLGITYFALGEDTCRLAMMAHHDLAQKKSLTRQDIAGQTIIINSGAHFNRWSRMVQRILGEDVAVKFHMNSIESMANLSFIDLGPSIYICGGESSFRYLSQRDDTVLFDKVDGEDLIFPLALLCRSEDAVDKNGAVFSFIEAFLDRCEEDPSSAKKRDPAMTC